MVQAEQFRDPAKDQTARTLYIGDLPNWVEERFLYSVFQAYGDLLNLKIIRNKHTGASEGYGFLDFHTHQAAARTLSMLNGTKIPNTDHIFKLNWAVYGLGKSYTETPDYSVFVGDLAPEVVDTILASHFKSLYPSVKGAKVINDQITGRSKGYGFVRFSDQSERDKALHEMQGHFLAGRPIRISIATQRKQAMPGQPQQASNVDADPTNTTIFIGGLGGATTEETLKKVFQQYGEIIYVKIPPGKGCGFVQFVGRAPAENALQAMNNKVIDNCVVRLSWGRSSKQTMQRQPQGVVMPFGMYDPSHYMTYGMDPYGRHIYGYPANMVTPDLTFGGYPYATQQAVLSHHMALQQAASKSYNPIKAPSVSKMNEAYMNTHRPTMLGAGMHGRKHSHGVGH